MMIRYSLIFVLLSIAAISAKSFEIEDAPDAGLEERDAAALDDNFEDLQEKSALLSPEDLEDEDEALKREVTGMDDNELEENPGKRHYYRHHSSVTCDKYNYQRAYYLYYYRYYLYYYHKSHSST
ncbi:hypothetical protein, partial [Salmonella sp. s51944]|uniref:hypothetical protein n=1 Tax=Salmonella sp. s51944 TaxID=3159655 RepID=UPI00397F793B